MLCANQENYINVPVIGDIYNSCHIKNPKPLCQYLCMVELMYYRGLILCVSNKCLTLLRIPIVLEHLLAVFSICFFAKLSYLLFSFV